MNDLIAKLEAAPEGSRELDAEICEAVGDYPEDWANRLRGYSLGYYIAWSNCAPAYTTSIDAALMLVPEGWAWKVGTCCVSDDAWCAPDFNHPVHGKRLMAELGPVSAGDKWDEGFDVDKRPAGNLALALCISALRAHAALKART